jgi:hypothetical protein
MKPIIYLLALISVLFVFSAESFAQCDRGVQRPIKCGYYDEGYEDGMNDARSSRGNDYRRYRNKLDTQYESFYRSGYDAGFAAAGPVNPPYPGPGGGSGRNSSGTATWSGRVDNVVQLTLQGNNLRAQDMTNSGMTTTNQNVNGYLPRRPVTVTANKFGGRGNVRVIQQPNRNNGFTAIVEISDPKGGADNYRVDINWESAGRSGGEEPYQSGRVTWRGRVDNTANITISGSSVTSEATAGQPLVGETFSINGYLASRPGTVTVRKIKGRGNVSVLQQPNWENEFTAVIQISDGGGGADDYQLEISW